MKMSDNLKKFVTALNSFPSVDITDTREGEDWWWLGGTLEFALFSDEVGPDNVADWLNTARKLFYKEGKENVDSFDSIGYNPCLAYSKSTSIAFFVGIN